MGQRKSREVGLYNVVFSEGATSHVGIDAHVYTDYSPNPRTTIPQGLKLPPILIKAITALYKSLSGAPNMPGKQDLSRVADDMFDRCDADDNGRLTQDEFLQGCKEHPEMATTIQNMIHLCIM